MLRRQFCAGWSPHWKLPAAPLSRPENEYGCVVAKQTLSTIGPKLVSKPRVIVLTALHVVNVYLRSRHRSTRRNSPWSWQYVWNDITNVVLMVNVHLTREHQHFIDTVETLRGISVAWSRLSMSVCVLPCYISVTQRVALIPRLYFLPV